MASASSASSDLAGQSGLYSVGRFTSLDRNRSLSGAGSDSVDDLWFGDFYIGSSGDGGTMKAPNGVQKEESEEITLEDFLARRTMQPQTAGDRSVRQYAHGAPCEGRGKRNMVEDPVERALLQRQKRMIKNRESAARSRERKQAYVHQLETLSAKLEEESAGLIQEQVEGRKARFKHLMNYIVPVVEREKPPGPPRLRRTCSR